MDFPNKLHAHHGILFQKLLAFVDLDPLKLFYRGQTLIDASAVDENGSRAGIFHPSSSGVLFYGNQEWIFASDKSLTPRSPTENVLIDVG